MRFIAEQNEDYKITYELNDKIKDRVVNELFRYFRKHGSWTGEVLMQDDDSIIEAPNLLSKILDDVLKTEIEEIE